MSETFPVKPGDTSTVAQLSLCAGGLVRTWGDRPQLWSVPDDAYLRSMMGTGTLARTVREQNRFREVAMVSEDSSTLWLQGRFPVASGDGVLQVDGSIIELQPAREPSASLYDDVHELLAQAIDHALKNNEYLLVEKGGWDAPNEPFCLFIVIPDGDGYVSIIETAPPPVSSEIWAPHVVAGQDSTTLSAPATRDTVEVAPLIMLDAIGAWGLAPWDLALTFGARLSGENS
ncbi:hypothetical protein [Mycolicibacterium mageritense]|jgi:hypothetical protein|uniref:hypothetical protein n=1 Tax=Mycolicibacterium mageritense TaxID=53462 RepID=UPI0011D5F001|nr:hypothetical protein [Mycolicibacterium mageritense]TXI53375.1 MAG: hypothetical protein E6Q55_35215 [Mycolicibacterium mageritense]